jgi:hypothetical protein
MVSKRAGWGDDQGVGPPVTSAADPSQCLGRTELVARQWLRTFDELARVVDHA